VVVEVGGTRGVTKGVVVLVKGVGVENEIGVPVPVVLFCGIVDGMTEIVE